MKVSFEFDHVPTARTLAETLARAAATLGGNPPPVSAPTSALDDEAETPAPAPAKRGRPAKAAEVEEEENADDGLGLDEVETAEEATSLEDVVAAMQRYAKKHGREKAVKILTKLGVKSVRDLKPAHYDAVVKAAGA